MKKYLVTISFITSSPNEDIIREWVDELVRTEQLRDFEVIDIDEVGEDND